MSDQQDLFERQLAAWGSRPAPTPAELASYRIMHRLPARRRPVVAWLAAAAAVLLAAAMLAIWRPQSSSPSPGCNRPPDGFLAVGGDTIAWIVDSETTILFTLELHETRKGQ